MYMYRLYMYLLDLLNGWDENCIISGALETVVVTMILVFTGSVETLGFWVNLQYILYIFFQMTVMIHTLALLLIEDTSGFNVFHSVPAFHSGCYRPPFSCPFSSWYGYVVQRLLLQEKRARYSLQCCVLCYHKKKKLIIHHSIKLWTRNWSDTITVKHEALLLSIFLLSREWPRQNFSLLYLYNIMQTSDENKKISIMGLLIDLKPKFSKLT